jgi:hypothetical protein
VEARRSARTKKKGGWTTTRSKTTSWRGTRVCGRRRSGRRSGRRRRRRSRRRRRRRSRRRRRRRRGRGESGSGLFRFPRGLEEKSVVASTLCHTMRTQRRKRRRRASIDERVGRGGRK